jgi:hypothetical protein
VHSHGLTKGEGEATLLGVGVVVQTQGFMNRRRWGVYRRCEVDEIPHCNKYESEKAREVQSVGPTGLSK